MFFQLIYSNEVKTITSNIIESTFLKKKYNFSETQRIQETLSKKFFESLLRISINNNSQVSKPHNLKFATKKVQKIRLKEHKHEIKLIEGFISSFPINLDAT